MTTTLGQVLADARSLVTRLHDRDRLADGLLGASQGLHEKINCMREYKEDLHELNELCHTKPRTALIHSLQQENRQIRQLQEENRSLRKTLEEYEAGLELIMGQHRSQMAQLRRFQAVHHSLQDAYARLEPAQESVSEVAQSREFAALFAECLKTGQESSLLDAQELSRLRTENRTLRELLTIGASNDPDALKRFRQILQHEKDGETKDGERTPRAGNSSPVAETAPSPLANGAAGEEAPKAGEKAPKTAPPKPKTLPNGTKAPLPKRKPLDKPTDTVKALGKKLLAAPLDKATAVS